MAKAEATQFSILVLSEVEPNTFEIFKVAAAEGLGHPIDFVTSASGGFGDTDSLMVAVDTTRLEIRDAIELHRHAGISANFNNDAIPLHAVGTSHAVQSRLLASSASSLRSPFSRVT